MDSTNEYGLVGAEFHKFLKDKQSESQALNNKVSSLLNKLELNGDIHIRYAKQEGMGDSSWFYFKEDVDDKDSLTGRKFSFERIKVQPSAMGAWQIYLLKTSNTVLPLFWHGLYDRRKYIFSNENLKNIIGIRGEKLFKNLDVSGIIEQFNLLPEVEVNNDIATVRCCYWNDWKGLVRETVTINFIEDGKFNIDEDVKTEILYAYDCGICY